MRALLLSAALVTCAATAAAASSSDWYKADGAHLRLLTSGLPDANGVLKGALEIDLKPGWKTYWRDPGGSGVPPSIDVSQNGNTATLDIAYPAPMRFDDASGPWVGYKHSVTFPVTFRLARPGDAGAIVADVFIGVCEAVCVPVQARLTVDPANDPDNADDLAAVEAALAALPGDAQPGFGVTLLSGDESQVEVEAAFSGDPGSVEFFLAGSDGYVFGSPVRSDTDGKVTFAVPILERPATKPSGGGLPYTLVTATGAVSGVLPFP